MPPHPYSKGEKCDAAESCSEMHDAGRHARCTQVQHAAAFSANAKKPEMQRRLKCQTKKQTAAVGRLREDGEGSRPWLRQPAFHGKAVSPRIILGHQHMRTLKLMLLSLAIRAPKFLWPDRLDGILVSESEIPQGGPTHPGRCLRSMQHDARHGNSNVHTCRWPKIQLNVLTVPARLKEFHRRTAEALTFHACRITYVRCSCLIEKPCKWSPKRRIVTVCPKRCAAQQCMHTPSTLEFAERPSRFQRPKTFSTYFVFAPTPLAFSSVYALSSTLASAVYAPVSYPFTCNQEPHAT